MKRWLMALMTMGVIGGGMGGFIREAHAVAIFFNGIKVTGLKNQTFQNCTVAFDANGNITITAPGYTVKRVDPANAPDGGTPLPPALAKRYFLISMTSGHAQYDVNVFINGKWNRKIRSDGDPVIQEVTPYLMPGKNVVQFTAVKNYSGKPRQSTSADHFLRILIGTAIPSGTTVNINRKLIDFKVSADSTDNYSREHSFSIP
jgi:hypothetical protein